MEVPNEYDQAVKHDQAVQEVATAVKEHAKTERRKTLDLDVRGVIGFMSVCGLFGIVFMQLITNRPIAIPAEVAGIVSGIIGYYYGSRAGNTNGK